MRAPDRSNVANRDGAYEGIGSIPEGDTSAPSQRYVIRVDIDGSHALGLISGDIYVGPEHKTYEATFITRDAWRAAEGDDAGSDLAPGPGRMFEGIAELQGWSPNTKIRLRLFVPDDQAQPLRLELKRRFLLAEFARTYPIYRADLHPVGGVHPYLRLIDLSVVYQPGVPRLGVFQAESPRRDEYRR